MEILNYPTSYSGFDVQDYFAELIDGKGINLVPTDYRCCLCGTTFEGYGHNPAPLTDDVRMRCCDACNRTFVREARMKEFKRKYGYLPKRMLFME